MEEPSDASAAAGPNARSLLAISGVRSSSGIPRTAFVIKLNSGLMTQRYPILFLLALMPANAKLTRTLH